MNQNGNAMVKNLNGYDLIDQEETAVMVAGLEDKISISLEGVDIVRGTHADLGFVTFVLPPAGDTILLYPFQQASVF